MALNARALGTMEALVRLAEHSASSSGDPEPADDTHGAAADGFTAADTGSAPSEVVVENLPGAATDLGAVVDEHHPGGMHH